MQILSLTTPFVFHLLLVTPVCRSAEPRIYGISVSEILNVTCDFEADPRDTQIRWSLNNSLGLQVMTNWTKGGPRSVFSYSPSTEDGYGTLMCWAKNSIGTQKEPCIIKVVPAGKSLSLLSACIFYSIPSSK